MNKITKLLHQFPNFKLLDIGTGVGNFIALVKSVNDDFEEIIGIDTSQRIVEIAKNNFKDDDRIQFLLMDANECSFENDTFDIVSLSNSLHHLSDIHKTISEMERVVKPTGIILIHEMVSDQLTDQQISHKMLHHYAAEIDREFDQIHGETYSREEIIDILQENSASEIIDFWHVVQEEEQEVSSEEIEQLIQLVDKLSSRVKESQNAEYFISKAEKISCVQ